MGNPSTLRGMSDILWAALRRVPREVACRRLLKNWLCFYNKNCNGPVAGGWEGVVARNFSQGDSPNIVSSPLGNVSVPNVSFHELIFKNWSLWENKTAVLCGETGRKYSYKDLMKKSKTLAAALQNKFGMEKGNYLAVVLPNCPEYPIIILASSQCGAVTTTVNPLYTVDEIKWQLEDCQAKVIVTLPKFYEKCFAVAKAMNAQIAIVVVKETPDDKIPEGGVDLSELFNPSTSGELKPVHIEMEDDLFLPYSSGTTGAPKGVLLTHKNLVSNLTQISHPETVIMQPTTRLHQDTVFGILPMFHIYGLVIITFYSLKDGCRLITLPRFKPQPFFSNLVRKKVRILYAVPPIIMLLSREEVRGRYLKSLHFVVNAASSMALQDAYKIIDKAEHIKIVQAYGMTESSPALAHTSTKRMQKLASIGIPIASTKLKISHLETGEALPKGEQGELCAFGPQLMKGYLNRPEATRNAFDKDGWLRTGDIAYYDDDGDFYIVERMKDLIKVKGFQVAPAELEEVLLMHPNIKAASVIGVPDSEYGEVPKAFVVLKEGTSMTEDEVKEFISRKLSSYKHLKGGVRFLDDLPKNNLGKVLRKELREYK